jgi:hypothetical protein
MPKPISLWITSSVPDAEDAATVRRFKRFAVDDKNYVKALKRLLDLAHVS